MRFIVMILSFLALAPQPARVFAGAVDKTTVVVLPMEVSREGSYAYLNRAINQMLLTRLTQYDELKVLGSELKPDARQKLRSLLSAGKFDEVSATIDADWLIDGSMYSLKDGLQINASLYPVSTGIPVTVSARAQGEEEVIGAVSLLAEQISAAVAKEEPEEAEDETDAQTGMTGFETPHPERDYKKGLYGGAGLLTGDDGSTVFESRGMRKSEPFPIAVVSLAAGDLNGDGTSEVIAASQSKIRVFSFNDLKFREIAAFDFSPRMKIHVINVGDHDGSGTMKLYVSGNEGRFASSAIFSWDGSDTLQPLRRSIPWYIRPIDTADGDALLAGQQPNSRVEDNFLQPGVFELTLDDPLAEVVQGEKLLLPEGTNLFDFVQADLDGDGQVETMIIDEKQKLLVYDSAFNLIWVSSANYGGSKIYFGPSRDLTDQQEVNGLTEAQQDRRDLVFIPGRLDLKDITGDGLPEVVVNTNEVGVDRYFTNTRFYDGGAIACLGWFGYGLAELWQTNHIEGYVADYFFDDAGGSAAAGNGKVLNRLYVAQIPVTTFVRTLLPGGTESRILAYEILTEQRENEQKQ